MHINIKNLQDHDILTGIITTLIMLILINICSLIVPIRFNPILHIGSILALILLIVAIIVQLVEKPNENKL